MPKLGYSKSRNGCTRCRQRRVKCDEKRPCTACIRHKVTCSLLTAPPTSSGHGAKGGLQKTPASYEVHPPVLKEAERRDSDGQSSFSGSTPGATSRSPAILDQSPTIPVSHPAPPNPFPLFSKYVLPQHVDRQDKTPWATDLELMHHWSTVTCFTLPRGQEVSHIWQTVIVEIALANEPLLHQILAITASHMAYLRPQQSQMYSMIASQHQSDAARGLRTALMKITSDNCHASFAAASVLVIGAFAAAASPSIISGKPTGGHQPTLADMLDIIVLTRGMALVLHSSEDIIQKGPFADLFRRDIYNTPQIFLEAVCGKLHELSIRILEDHSIDQATVRVVNCEIHNFITCIKDSITNAPHPTNRITTLWPTSLSEDFLALLHRKVSPALAVFTYFCAVVHESQTYSWYTKGWGLSVAKDVERFIQEPWTEAIRWPMDCMSLSHGA